MKQLSSWLQKISRGWVVLATLVIFGLFTAFVLPDQAAKAELNTGSEQSPDTSFYYTKEDLYRMAQAYGEAGRAAYIRARFTFDLVWPLVYLAFLTTAIGWLFPRGFQPGSFWQLSNLAPVLGTLFDYLENISSSLVMARFPAPTDLMASLAPFFTMVKWLFVGGSFILLLLGLMAWFWRKMEASRKRSS